MPTQPELDEVEDGVEAGTSTGDAPSTNQSQPNRQTSSNWQADPAFREVQSKWESRVAQAQNAAYQAQQEAARAREEAQMMRLRGLEGEELLTEKLRIREQQLMEMQRQRDLDLYALQRQRDLEEIVAMTGVPLDKIEGAPNVHVAWKIGQDFQKKNSQTQTRSRTRQEVIEDEADDSVDLGAGKATNANKSWQDKYDTHRKNFNMKEALDVMAEAERRGVTINEW